MQRAITRWNSTGAQMKPSARPAPATAVDTSRASSIRSDTYRYPMRSPGSDSDFEYE